MANNNNIIPRATRATRTIISRRAATSSNTNSRATRQMNTSRGQSNQPGTDTTSPTSNTTTTTTNGQQSRTQQSLPPSIQAAHNRVREQLNSRQPGAPLAATNNHNNHILQPRVAQPILTNVDEAQQGNVVKLMFYTLFLCLTCCSFLRPKYK